MPLTRRQLLTLSVGAAAGYAARAAHGAARPRPKIRALAFDAFPVLDPRPVYALAEELFPGQGAELSAVWRSRQFEYTWLRVASRQYEEFWKVTEDALVFAAKAQKVELTPEKRRRLMDTFLELKAYPDAPPVLRSLRDAGVRLGFLSNATPEMLHAGIKNSGLDGLFEHVLSTDQIRTYKPDPHAYRLGTHAFRLDVSEILFVAFAGWDAAGARSFGYPTYWVNRLNLPAEELGVTADGVGRTLADLERFVRERG